MSSTRRQLAISLALIFATAFSCTIVHGQDAKGLAQSSGDWSAINSVPSGDKLLVKLKNGQSVEGSLNSFSNDALALSVKGKSMDVKRDEVLSVYHVTGKSATKATLIRLAVGAGGGFEVGAAARAVVCGFQRRRRRNRCGCGRVAPRRDPELATNDRNGRRKVSRLCLE